MKKTNMKCITVSLYVILSRKINHRWPMDSPHIGPKMQKALTCYEVCRFNTAGFEYICEHAYHIITTNSNVCNTATNFMNTISNVLLNRSFSLSSQNLYMPTFEIQIETSDYYVDSICYPWINLSNNLPMSNISFIIIQIPNLCFYDIFNNNSKGCLFLLQMWVFLRCRGIINAMPSLMIGQYSVFDQALSIIDIHVTTTCITQCVVANYYGETMWVITHKTLSVSSLKIECLISCTTQKKNDATTWKHFSHFWPFDGNLRSPIDSHLVLLHRNSMKKPS